MLLTEGWACYSKGIESPGSLFPRSWEWSAPGQRHCWCQRNGQWARPPAERGPGTISWGSFLSDGGSQSRVSFQPEGAQLGGDLRTAALLKEIFVSLRMHGALQAGLVRCARAGGLATTWQGLGGVFLDECRGWGNSWSFLSRICPRQDLTRIQGQRVLCSKAGCPGGIHLLSPWA